MYVAKSAQLACSSTVQHDFFKHYCSSISALLVAVFGTIQHNLQARAGAVECKQQLMHHGPIELGRVAASLGCLSARPGDLRLGRDMCLGIIKAACDLPGLRTDDAGLKFPSSF